MADFVPETYLRHIANIRKVARSFGYAICTHGSLSRDIDLVAVPWVENVEPPKRLAEAICNLVSGHFSQALKPGYSEEGCPGRKPHGRLCWCINVGNGVYFDLSVIPPSNHINKEGQ